MRRCNEHGRRAALLVAMLLAGCGQASAPVPPVARPAHATVPAVPAAVRATVPRRAAAHIGRRQEQHSAAGSAVRRQAVRFAASPATGETVARLDARRGGWAPPVAVRDGTVERYGVHKPALAPDDEAATPVGWPMEAGYPPYAGGPGYLPADPGPAGWPPAPAPYPPPRQRPLPR